MSDQEFILIQLHDLAKLRLKQFKEAGNPEAVIDNCIEKMAADEIERLQHHSDEQSKDIRGYVERENKLQAENERLLLNQCNCACYCKECAGSFGWKERHMAALKVLENE